MKKIPEYNHLYFGHRPSYKPASKPPSSENEVKEFLSDLFKQNIFKIVNLLDEQNYCTGYVKDLTSIYKETEVINSSFKHREFPIPRFSYPQKNGKPDFFGLTKLIEELVLDEYDGRKTYIHCSGGRGRSGIIIACLLFLKTKDLELSLEKSKEIAHIRNDGQEQFVIAWTQKYSEGFKETL